MALTSLLTPDLLPLLLCHLTRQDAASLAVVCRAAAATCRHLEAASSAVPSYTPAPRVIICASGSKQLLVAPLTPHGQAYMVDAVQQQPRAGGKPTRIGARPSSGGQRRHLQAVAVCTGGSSKRDLPWVTGIVSCPYNKQLYVAAYACDTAPASVLQFRPGSLRRSGCLVSGPEIEDPEGLAIARQTCFIASAGHAAVVAVALQDGRGSIQQTLALAEDAVPWGMAAWDPSTFPLHALAAREAATAATAARQPTHCKQQQEGQAQARPSAQPVNAFPSPARAALPQHTPAAAAAADDAADGFLAAAAQGCLLVAVQSDVAKKQWWLPPAGPASGSLLCIPLGSGSGGPGQTCMLEWREWSRVKVKRPSGVTIDHAGHVWTTSLERLLLRFAGPCHPHTGSLLQQVQLAQVLPGFARQLYPMDVQAAVQISQAGSRESLLVVTVHAGPRSRGAVAVLRLPQEGGAVRLAACWGDWSGPRLAQPNMVAIL